MISPYTTFFCDGSYSSPTTSPTAQKFNCWAPDGHGSLDLIGAITQSCDVYFYNVGYPFYNRKGTELEDWAKRLGMGKPTGIDIPGEFAGRVPTPAGRRAYFQTEIDKIWKPGDSVNLSIGQGNLEATPLQLAVTYAAIANGGYIVTPHLGLKVVDSPGQIVRDLEPPRPRKVDMRRARSTSSGRACARRRPRRAPRRRSSAATRSPSPARPAPPRSGATRSALRTTPGTRATRRPTTPSTSSSS